MLNLLCGDDGVEGDIQRREVRSAERKEFFDWLGIGTFQIVIVKECDWCWPLVSDRQLVCSLFI